MSFRVTPSRRAAFLLAACAVAYVLLDRLSYIHPLQQSSITPWNPHPAFAIAPLAMLGQRGLPFVFAGVMAAEVVVRGASPGWATSLLLSIVLTLGYAAMGTALSGLVPDRLALRSRVDLGRLIGVVALGSLVTGALYVGALWAAGGALPGPYFEALMQFWIGDCVGVLVTLPLVFMLADPGRREQLSALARQPIAWLQAASIGLALWLVFGPLFGQPFKLFYILFLPLVWIAVSQGLLGAALAVLAIQAGVIAAVQAVAFPTLTVFELQALAIALAITGLVLGVVVDERRLAADELRDSLRLAAAGEMSAALAHELNQPLTALVAYAQAAKILADAREPDAAAVARTLDRILAEANRTADVVRRLRDFFRTGATNLEDASLPELALGVVENLRPKAASAGVALEQEASASVPVVLVDCLQIEVVLRNLLANGVEAAAHGESPRWVRVEIGTDDRGQARAVVRDSGRGVAEAVAGKIFDPFWTSRASGMGMGLAISRAIVEAHGGRLWIERDRGGAFAFTLPASHA